VTRFCEHTKDFSGSVNGGEYLISLIECEVLNKISAPWI
jgi:hypothetical protein